MNSPLQTELHNTSETFTLHAIMYKTILHNSSNNSSCSVANILNYFFAQDVPATFSQIPAGPSTTLKE